MCTAVATHRTSPLLCSSAPTPAPSSAARHRHQRASASSPGCGCLNRHSAGALSNAPRHVPRFPPSRLVQHLPSNRCTSWRRQLARAGVGVPPSGPSRYFERRPDPVHTFLEPRRLCCIWSEFREPLTGNPPRNRSSKGRSPGRARPRARAPRFAPEALRLRLGARRWKGEAHQRIRQLERPSAASSNSTAWLRTYSLRVTTVYALGVLFFAREEKRGQRTISIVSIRRAAMATYPWCLANFTDQGIRGVEHPNGRSLGDFCEKVGAS